MTEQGKRLPVDGDEDWSPEAVRIRQTQNVAVLEQVLGTARRYRTAASKAHPMSGDRWMVEVSENLWRDFQGFMLDVSDVEEARRMAAAMFFALDAVRKVMHHNAPYPAAMAMIHMGGDRLIENAVLAAAAADLKQDKEGE